MTHMNKKFSSAFLLIFIFGVSFVISGCAPLLVGAGAVGGYKVAEHTNAHDGD